MDNLLWSSSVPSIWSNPKRPIASPLLISRDNQIVRCCRLGTISTRIGWGRWFVSRSAWTRRFVLYCSHGQYTSADTAPTNKSQCSRMASSPQSSITATRNSKLLLLSCRVLAPSKNPNSQTTQALTLIQRNPPISFFSVEIRIYDPKLFTFWLWSYV